MPPPYAHVYINKIKPTIYRIYLYALKCVHKIYENLHNISVSLNLLWIYYLILVYDKNSSFFHRLIYRANKRIKEFPDTRAYALKGCYFCK